MSATLIEPVIHEHEPVPFVTEAVETKPPVIAEPQAKAETNPLIIIGIACFIAFNLAVVMIGSITAWIYFLRDSGAFAP